MLDILLNLQQRAPSSSSSSPSTSIRSSPASPRTCYPNYLEEPGRALPHRGAGHLLGRQARDPRGQDHLRPVLAPAPGHPYRAWPAQLGATKIALGHHRDDMIVTTLFLNMFFGGMKGMPPKLVATTAKNVVIRPLAYVRARPARWAEHRQFPIIPCNPAGSQGEPPARPGQGHDQRVGSAATPAASTTSSPPCSIVTST